MIRPLPPAPSRDNPGPFASQADALLTALAGFVDDCNALEQSLIFVGTTGQSSTALAVGAGTKTLTASTGKAWVVGAWVHLVSASGIGNVMVGQVLDYDVDTGELQVNVGAFAGTGTHSDWLIGLSSPQAPITSALIANGALAAKVGAEGGLLLPGDADAALKAVPKQQLDAVAALLDQVCPPGTISPKASLTTPARWLLIDGKTIGNAASGATARANADTARLFEKLWAFPAAAVLIFDSTGAPSVRGASAAADFAAGKRLALFSSDGGGFLRLWAPGQTTDIGRVAGSMQEDAFQGHEHQLFDVQSGGGGGYLGSGSDNWTRNTQQIVQKPGYSPARVADETRPYNLAVPHYIFLGVA